MIHIPTLSFCITCKNRFYQIRNTLQKNLDDNRMFDFLVEFILVDFGSTDGLREWIAENFKPDLSTGYLKYYYTDKLEYWHASIAKNTAHFLSQNDIVVNLDCDNYTGHNGGKYVIQNFLAYKWQDIIFHQRDEDLHNGAYGRIGVLRKHFDSIGGYDESLGPMGHQDTDLIARLSMLGLIYVRNGDQRYNQAIRNTKNESIAYTNSDMQWYTMNEKNKHFSYEKIANARIIANHRLYGIRENIQDISGNIIV